VAGNHWAPRLFARQPDSAAQTRVAAQPKGRSTAETHPAARQVPARPHRLTDRVPSRGRCARTVQVRFAAEDRGNHGDVREPH
jgi:hypothetical protein